MSNRKVPTSILIPQELFVLIERDAKAERRSRSNVIVKRLLEHYRLDDKLVKGDPNADEIG